MFSQKESVGDILILRFFGPITDESRIEDRPRLQLGLELGAGHRLIVVDATEFDLRSNTSMCARKLVGLVSLARQHGGEIKLVLSDRQRHLLATARDDFKCEVYAAVVDAVIAFNAEHSTSHGVAIRSSWKISGCRKVKTPVPYEDRFSEAEYQLLLFGLIPRAMDDKWFVFVENSVLHCHRSASGYCLYQVEPEKTGDSVTARKACVTSKKSVYRPSRTAGWSP